MLLPDLGYPIRHADEDEKIQALLAFGQLQRRSVSHVDQLLRMGCPDRRLDKLPSQLDLLTQVDRATTDFTDLDMESLPPALARLKEITMRLASHNIPYTVGHGDLHLGNVARHEGQFVFFDWGQGSVSHPFLDAWMFVMESEMQDVPEEEYLAPWTECAPMPALREAFALSRQLWRLNETIDHYHFCTNLKLEPEELPDCLVDGLREILAWAETEPS